MTTAHDPAYCDANRPRGSVCNQPHAANDPLGMRSTVKFHDDVRTVSAVDQYAVDRGRYTRKA